MIDQIIDYNKTFVKQKSYEKYITDKYSGKGGIRDVLALQATKGRADNIVRGYQLA